MIAPEIGSETLMVKDQPTVNQGSAPLAAETPSIESLLAELAPNRALTKEQIAQFLSNLPENQRKDVEASLSFREMEHLGQLVVTPDVLENATHQFSQRIRETRGLASGTPSEPKKHK